MSARPLRILAICTDYPPALGGIATLSSQLVRALSSAGHEVRVLCGTESGRDPITGEACASVGAHIPIGHVALVREFRLGRQLGRLVRNWDPDVVWASTWFPGAVAAVMGARGGAGRVVCFSAYASEIMPNTTTPKQRVKALLGPFRRRCLRESDRILAISSFTRGALIGLGAAMDRVSVVPGGVADGWFAVQRVPPGAWKTLLTVARLDEHKGHDVVIRSLPDVIRQHPLLRYDIVGPGEPKRLRDLAARLGVSEHVRFRGALPTRDVMHAMSEASVFVMPSRQMPGRPDLIEGFGLAFLEAAAAGLPTVGGDSGGVPDAIVHDYTGFLVDPTSVGAVGNAVAQLLADPDRAQRMGQAGRERAYAQFRWPVVAQRMLDALRPSLDAVGRPV